MYLYWDAYIGIHVYTHAYIRTHTHICACIPAISTWLTKRETALNISPVPIIKTKTQPAATRNIHTHTITYVYHYIKPSLYVRLPLCIMHKYLRAGPADMPLGSWCLTGTKYFHLPILVRWKWTTPCWVLNPVPHSFVQRIRHWSILSSWTDFVYLYRTKSKIISKNHTSKQWR